MPISADVYLDKNSRRYGLPMDSCVGDEGPSPTEVTTIATPSGQPVSGYKAGKTSS